MKNAMSLKAKIRNMAKQKNIPAQVVLQNYMFERLLVRLSKSTYKDKFVVKGGMLISAIVGLDHRATMDLDTTIRNLSLTQETIEQAFAEICNVSLEDNVFFEIYGISPIREDDIYGGYRVMLNAKYDTIVTPLSVDVTAGDVITPYPVKFSFYELFDKEKSFELWTYNIETIMAEKMETILRRTVFSTRPRDFYDTYILAATQEIDKTIFSDALRATASHRGSSEKIANTDEIIKNIAESTELRSMWDKYRRQFAYAETITYEEILEKLKEYTKGE